LSSWSRQLGRALIPPPEPGNEVYGTVTVAALLAVESGRRETLWQAGLSVSVAIVALWLAHGYAGGVGQRFGDPEDTALGHLVSSLRTEVGILRGLIIPVAVLIVCGLSGVSDPTAISAAFISSILVLVAVELFAGLRSSRRGRDVLVEIAISLVVGAAVVFLKIIVH
jgi:hypothetical protein